MPIFEIKSTGEKYRVKDENVAAFAEKYPDAFTRQEVGDKKYRVPASKYFEFLASQQPVEEPAQQPVQQVEQTQVESQPAQQAEAQPVTTQQPVQQVEQTGYATQSVNAPAEQQQAATQQPSAEVKFEKPGYETSTFEDAPQATKDYIANPPKVAEMFAGQKLDPDAPLTDEQKTMLTLQNYNGILRTQDTVDAFSQWQADFNEYKDKRMKNLTMGGLDRAVDGGIRINTELGEDAPEHRVQQTYLTPYGNRYTDKAKADAETRMYGDRYKKPTLSAIARLLEAYKRLDDLKAQRDKAANVAHERAQEFVDEKLTGFGKLFAGADVYSGITTGDSTKAALDAAIASTEETIRKLEEQRDRQLGNDPGFWRATFGVFGKFSTWDLGYTDLQHDASRLGANYVLNEKKDATADERAAYEALLEVDDYYQQVVALYGKNENFWYRAGDQFGHSVPFMLQFMMMNPGSSATQFATKGATKIATKAIGKEAAEQMAKKGVIAYVKDAGWKGAGRVATDWTIKALGQTADDMLVRVPMMMGTVGMPKVLSDATELKLGDVVVDEFGNLSYENSKTWGYGLWQAGADNYIEYLSEMSGELLPSLSMKSAAEIFGASRLGNLLAKASANELTGIAGATNKFLNKLGIQGYVGEVSEEYYGQAWRSALGLESAYTQDEFGNRINLFQSGQFHGDMWGGMALTVGLTHGLGMGFTSAQYAYLQHGVRKADTEADAVFGRDYWNVLRQAFDNTTNEEIGKVIDAVMLDKSMTEEQRKAAMKYLERMLILRGFNLGSVAQSRGTADEDAAAADESYLEGYNCTEEEWNNVKRIYEAQRQRMKMQGAADDVIDSYSIDELINLARFFRQKAAEHDQRAAELMNDDATMDYANAEKQASEQALRNAETVMDYANAKQVYEGVKQRVRDDIDFQIEEMRATADNRTNKDTGQMEHAVMKQDDRGVFIVRGKVVVRDDGSVDLSASDSSIIIRDAKTGTLEQVSPSALLTVDQVVDPGMYKYFTEMNIRAKAAQEAADKIDGKVTFNEGDTYVLTAPDGTQSQVTVTANEQGVIDNGDGTVNVKDESGKIVAVPKETIQQQVDAQNEQRVQEFEQERQAQNEAARQAAQQQKPKREYKINDTVTLRREDGEIVHGTIASVDKDGVVVDVDKPINGQRAAHFTSDELDGILVEHNGESIGQTEQTQPEPAQQQPQQPEQPVPPAPAAPEAPEMTDAENAIVNAKPDKPDEPQPPTGGAGAVVEEQAAPVQAVPTEQAPVQATEPTVEQSEQAAPTESAPAQQTEPQQPQTALERIPKDEQGQPLYELTDSDTAWDALVEQTGGDAQMAQEVAESMLADKEAALKKLEKAKVKSGGGVTEKIAAATERKNAIEQAKREVEAWRNIAQTPARRQAAIEAEQEAQQQAQAQQTVPEQVTEESSATEQQPTQEQVAPEQTEQTTEQPATTEQEAQSGLTREEAQAITDSMKQHAEVAPEMELNPDNWDAEFGKDGIVQTPIGKVKMGENQYLKLLRRGRSSYFGMVKPTLVNPDMILEEYDPKDGAERATKYLFVKTFKKPDGGRYVHFESVTVLRDNLEVSISSHEIDESALINKVHQNKLIHLDDKFSSSEWRLTGPQNEGSDLVPTPNSITSSTLETSRPTNSRTDVDSNLSGKSDDTATRQSADVSESKDTETSQTNNTSEEKVSEEANQATPDFVAPERQEGESTLDYAERVAKEYEIDEERKKVETNPTEAQKKAGNYRKGHVELDGFDITIENPKGSVRSGVDANGQAWETTMQNDYGYLRGAKSKDGDQIDVFLSEHPTQGDVYVVDQVNPETGEFDEHKVMYGFNSEQEARDAYLANYEPGWKGLGNITKVSKADFKKWVESSGRKIKPFAEYKKNGAQKKTEQPTPSQTTEQKPAKKKSQSRKKEAQTKQTEQSDPVEKIEDVGEKIGGARKDLASELAERKKKAEENPDDVLADIRGLSLSKIFNFDYAKLREEGVPNEVITLMQVIRDLIPSKPRNEYKLKRWADKVFQEYRWVLNLVTMSAEEQKRVVNSYLSPRSWENTRMMMQARMALGGYDGGMQIGKAKLVELGATAKSYDKEGNMVSLEGHWYISDAGKYNGIYPTREEAVAALRSFAGDNAITKNGRKEVKFSVYHQRSNDSYYITVEGKPSIIVQAGFKTGKEAFDYIKEHRSELEASYQGLRDRAVIAFREQRPRQGRDWRAGKDVSAEEFRETFGFRGVEFGNWTNQLDRQTALNKAYDALMDLAEAIGKSPRALSLNGELGIAFGARGGGNAAAHYEADKVVINLTKPHGAGALAHEWWHAVDNYFARRRGEKHGYNTDRKGYTYDWQKKERLSPQEREEITHSFEELVGAIDKSGYGERSRRYADLKSDYWKRPTELGARAFETWVERKLSEKEITNDFLVTLSSRWDNEELASRYYPYPMEGDFETLDTAFDNLFNAIEEKVDEETGNTVLYREGESSAIEEVNERFNEQLEGLTEENANNVTLSLGRPSAILRAAGVEDKPMKLYGNKVFKKIKKHGYTLDEIKDLPKAVANPIAVFNNYEKDGNRSILTELRTANGNFLVAVNLGKDADVDFNIVTSVFGKGSSNIVDWINRGFATYINKEKAQEFLSHQSALYAATAANSELLSASKIVENFENPNISEENSQDGTTATDEQTLKRSDRRKEKDETNYYIDYATAFVTGRTIGEARQERLANEQKRRDLAREIYDSVLRNDYNDVLLQQINDYINAATPNNPYGRRISQRVPQKMERRLHAGHRTNAVDALYTRIAESAVGSSGKKLEGNRSQRERTKEKKKELLKQWAIATGNWHTSISDFTNETEPIARGKDSDVYKSKEEGFVVKFSKGKSDTRFSSDIDAVNLFNHVFPNTAYSILGYGEIDGQFVTILQQPTVFFESALTEDERVEYMRSRGFKPINDENTAFSNGEIVVSDLQKANIVHGTDGKTYVIDADVKLHTKDVGGNYTYPPASVDTESRTYGGNVEQSGSESQQRQGDTTTTEQKAPESITPDTLSGRNEMAKQVTELAEKLHLPNVEVVTSVSGLEGKDATAKGFYNPQTGKITVVIPNNANVADAIQTLLHEAVAHYGLRQLFGENFNTFLDNVFENAAPEVRRGIVALAGKNGWNSRTATEEYLASLAEKTNFEQAKKSSWWQKIKDFFAQMFDKLGLPGFKGTTLSDNELRYILWRSYQNLREGNPGGILAQAADTAMQYELGVGQYSNDVLYRDGSPEVREQALVRDRYEQRMRSGWYQSWEATQDSMLSLKEFMTMVAGKGTHIEDIAGFQNAYLGENRLSSVNKAEADAFAHLLFKPLLDEVAGLAKTGAARQELTDYMFAKHGLERNRVMAERDAQKAFEEYQKKHPNGTKTLQDFIDKFRQKDYAGLTALTGYEDVAEAELEAELMVSEYEDAHDTATLWDRVNAANKAILSKSYESGMMSKEVYDNISSMYEYYIPLRGFDQKTSAEAYAYLNDKNSAFNAPFKRAEGRKSKADDPLAYMQSMAESVIAQGNRNALVKQKFLNFVLNNPSDLVSVNQLWVQYDEVADEWKPVFPDNIDLNDSAAEVERKMQEFEEKMQQLAEAEPDKYKKGREAANIPYRVVTSNDLHQHQVVVKRNGVDYILTINGNPRLAQALNGQTNPDNDIEGWIGKLVAAGQWANRQLSGLYTTRNPNFVVSNFLRDMLYANIMVWVKESPSYAWRFNRNVAKLNPATMLVLLTKYHNGTLDMNNKTEAMFHDFIMNGGETGYTNIRDIDKHKSDINRELKKANGKLPVNKALGFLGERLDDLNRAVENCARFAAFMTSREMGRTIERSIYDAKEISVNFNKKGSGGKFIGAQGQTKLGNVAAFISGAGRTTQIFWNASIQGLTNFGRQFKRHPAKAFTAAASLFLLGALMAYLGGDDDEDDKNSYYNLSDHIRRNNILFRAGDYWISIPLPIEYRAIYGMGELMMSTLNGKEHLSDEELAYKIAAQVTQIMPIDILEGKSAGGTVANTVADIIMPSFLQPVWEAYFTNKDWTGMPISKDNSWNEDMPEWTKAYSSTNKYIVDMAATLNEWTGGDEYTKGAVNLNPARIEHLLEGYFGGIWTTVDQLGKTAATIAGQREFDARNILILNRVMKTGSDRTEYRAINNEYYRMKDEHDYVDQRLNGYESKADMGILKYAEKLDFLNNSPEYERYEIFEEYNADINDLSSLLKEARMDAEATTSKIKEMRKDPEADQDELAKKEEDLGKFEEEIKSIESEMYAVKKEMLEQMAPTFDKEIAKLYKALQKADSEQEQKEIRKEINTKTKEWLENRTKEQDKQKE